MRSDILIIALITGACTWAFRFLPTRADLGQLPPGGIIARLLGALGPAAIAALFVAEVLPDMAHPLASQGPLLAGVLATIATFALSRSVVGATMAGSVAYGVVLALLT